MGMEVLAPSKRASHCRENLQLDWWEWRQEASPKLGGPQPQNPDKNLVEGGGHLVGQRSSVRLLIIILHQWCHQEATGILAMWFCGGPS